MKPDDNLKIAPTLRGMMGLAWKVDIEKVRRAKKLDNSTDATLALWVVEAPWAHPWWHSYGIVLIHLRPLATPHPTIVYLEGATHEMWLARLNPDKPRHLMILRGAFQTIAPLNFAAQFVAESDEAAIERIKVDAVQAIIDGKISPDQDFVRRWCAKFGDNMMRK